MKTMSGYKYENCVLAYLDILGFKDRVSDLENNPPEIKKLVKTFKRNDFFKDATEKGNEIPFRGFFFSDSFVFIVKKNKESIPNLFLVVRYLHDNLLMSGLLLRGAIVSDLLYWPKPDENIILGPAMIKAYELESKVAIYPRIIISNSLYDYIEKRNILAKPLANEGHLKDYIKRDEDGIYFFDILNPQIIRKKGEDVVSNGKKSFAIRWNPGDASKYEEVIQKVEEISKKQLGNKDLSIVQKYEWLLSYVKSIRGDEGER